MDTWQDGEEEHWIEMIRETRGQNFVVDCELTINYIHFNGRNVPKTQIIHNKRYIMFRSLPLPTVKCKAGR